MTRSRTFLILLFSSIATLILLSGCNSKDASRQDTAAALPNTSEAASAPGQGVSTAPEDSADAEEAPTQADTEEKPVVTMTVWSLDDWKKKFVYTLTPEDSSRVIAILESAEREYLDSPVANVESMEFVYGENRLGTTPEDIETITGDLDGRHVCLELDEAACIELRQIATKYADPDMPSEWSDTPSADAE